MTGTDGRRRPPPAALKFNKIAEKLAGSRFFPPWALVHHTGRTSGKSYRTPVAIMTHDPAVIVIGLAWGKEADWVRNIVAAGGCTIEWKGRRIPVTQPTFIDKDTALRAAGPVQRFLLGRTPPPAFLQLRRQPS